MHTYTECSRAFTVWNGLLGLWCQGSRVAAFSFLEEDCTSCLWAEKQWNIVASVSGQSFKHIVHRSRIMYTHDKLLSCFPAFWTWRVPIIAGIYEYLSTIVKLTASGWYIIFSLLPTMEKRGCLTLIYSLKICMSQRLVSIWGLMISDISKVTSVIFQCMKKLCSNVSVLGKWGLLNYQAFFQSICTGLQMMECSIYGKSCPEKGLGSV